MAAFAGHRVDEDKAPEPIKSLLRALGEMGYSVAAWDADMEMDTYDIGSRSGYSHPVPTGMVEFTIHVSAVRAISWPKALPPPAPIVTAPATPSVDEPERKDPPVGWLPGDDDTWWHDR